MKWNSLSMQQRSRVMAMMVRHGVRDLDTMHRLWDEHDEEFQREESNNPPFVQRFSEGQRRAIPMPDGYKATHLLSVVSADGRYYAYPQVQPTDYGDTNSPLKDYGGRAFDRAFEHGDTLGFPVLNSALRYTENYKRPPSTGAFVTPYKNVADPAIGVGQLLPQVFADGGAASQAEPNEPVYYGGMLPEVRVAAQAPYWKGKVSDYDIARARRYYSDSNGNLTPRGTEFLNNIATKNATGKSQYMKDTDRLAAIPIAAVGLAGGMALLPAPAAQMALDGAVGLGFAAQEFENGQYGSAALDLGLAALPFVGPATRGIKAARAKKALSTLDWDAKKWFSKRIDGKYDKEDVAALRKHVPEYRRIERNAKQNGTWLKMPDGSEWQGDPHEWVMMQSKSYKDSPATSSEAWFRGQREINEKTVEKLRDKQIWGSDNKWVAASYTKNPMVDEPSAFTFPDGIPTYRVNANGESWEAIPYDYRTQDGRLINTYMSTDQIVENNIRPNSRVIIENVVDPGNVKYRRMLKNFPRKGKGINREAESEYVSRTMIGNDITIDQNVPRKYITGNNGNFDASLGNIYKGIIPLGLVLPTTYE